jgi:hypothetical protein
MVLVVCGILAHSWQQAEISCVFIERNRERVIQFVPMTFLPIEENESPTFDDMFSLDTDVLDDMLTTLA